MKKAILKISAFAFAITAAFASFGFKPAVETGYYLNSSNQCTQYGSIDCVTTTGQTCTAAISGLGTVTIFQSGCVTELKKP